MSTSLIVQGIVLLAAVFLMVRGVQVLCENVQVFAYRKKLPAAIVSAVYVLPVVVFVVLATARLGTMESILPLVIGWNLLLYGVVCAYVMMSPAVIQVATAARSLVVPMILTYALVFLSASDGSIDRFEALLMLVMAAVFCVSSPKLVTPLSVEAPSSLITISGLLVMSAVAVCLGTYYLFVGVLFFSSSFSISLTFLALTLVALALAVPVIFSTLSAVREAAHAEALTQAIEVTLLVTLCSIGVAGSIIPLTTSAITVSTGLWYMFACAAAVGVGLLLGKTERRSGYLLFLLFIFCMVKLVALM